MSHITHLYSPLTIKEIEFKNRIWVSPMCQYSSQDGHPTDWHLVHLGSRAVGGAGLVMVEATAVTPEGRITPDDSGIWSAEHIASFKRITDFIKTQDAIVGIQLAHAGRKASTAAPWVGGFLPPAKGGWVPSAPSAIPFQSEPAPKAMTIQEIEQCIADFVAATHRCIDAGFQVLELHMAHGYLMHEFLSPLSNKRTDEYGGSLENRMRLPLALTKAVRAVWPAGRPLFVRISTTDWAGGPAELNARSITDLAHLQSWHVFEAIIFAQQLKALGVDLIDCSSGGNIPDAKIPVGPNYQVPFASLIREQANIKTAAVGMIVEPYQAEAILLEQQADAIFMAREFLRNPYWPVHAAKSLKATIDRPKQYGRA